MYFNSKVSQPQKILEICEEPLNVFEKNKKILAPENFNTYTQTQQTCLLLQKHLNEITHEEHLYSCRNSSLIGDLLRYYNTQSSNYDYYQFGQQPIECLIYFGASAEEVLALIKEINNPEFPKLLNEAFQKAILNKERFLEGFRNYLSNNFCLQNVYSLLEFFPFYQDGDNYKKDFEGIDFTTIYKKFLEYAEDICTKFNESNLKYFQYYGDKVKITTEENRWSKTIPKASNASTLQFEKIEQIEDAQKKDQKLYHLHRTYQIQVKHTDSLSGYRYARKIASRCNFNKNAHRSINIPEVPYITPIGIKAVCTKELELKELLDAYRNHPEVQTDARFDEGYRYITCLFHNLYPQFKQETKDIILNLFNQPLPKSNQPIHDLLYRYYEMASPLFSNSVLKHILSLPLQEVGRWDVLDGARPRKPQEWKDLRKIIYKNFRKGVSPEEIKQECLSYLSENTLKDYKLSHAQLEYITKHYMPILKRYKERISIESFLSIFGKHGIQKILKKKITCPFESKEYRLPSLEKTALASIVHERIGSLRDSENLATRKRLYNRINSLHPMEEVLAGKIPDELIPQIKKILNLSPTANLDGAKNFSARIEEKCSPEFLIAGDASVCCMSLGTGKAVQYALQPGFGIFNIYFKDRIIANSLLWENENEDGTKTLVIDNIEVHPNYQCHSAYLKEMYHQFIKDMSPKYKAIVQGHTYNDLKLYTHNETPSGELKNWNPVGINCQFYSDADDKCYCVAGDSTDLFLSEMERKLKRYPFDDIEEFDDDDEEIYMREYQQIDYVPYH